MHRPSNPNIALLERAVDRLGPLTSELVFVGGCATGLLITDTAAPPIRTTLDVDVITEVATRKEYYSLTAKLRDQGFTEDMSPDAPICRWVTDDTILDVMPTNPAILGFGNQWYLKALEHAQALILPSGSKIRVVTGPYFLATKIAAFAGRGNSDYVMSRDIEDIVAVVDGRPEIVTEVRDSEDNLRRHLSTEVAALLSDRNFVSALQGHLPGDTASQSRLPIVLQRLREFALSVD